MQFCTDVYVGREQCHCDEQILVALLGQIVQVGIFPLNFCDYIILGLQKIILSTVFGAVYNRA